MTLLIRQVTSQHFKRHKQAQKKFSPSSLLGCWSSPQVGSGSCTRRPIRSLNTETEETQVNEIPKKKNSQKQRFFSIHRAVRATLHLRYASKTKLVSCENYARQWERLGDRPADTGTRTQPHRNEQNGHTGGKGTVSHGRGDLTRSKRRRPPGR